MRLSRLLVLALCAALASPAGAQREGQDNVPLGGSGVEAEYLERLGPIIAEESNGDVRLQSTLTRSVGKMAPFMVSFRAIRRNDPQYAQKIEAWRATVQAAIPNSEVVSRVIERTLTNDAPTLGDGNGDNSASNPPVEQTPVAIPGTNNGSSMNNSGSNTGSSAGSALPNEIGLVPVESRRGAAEAGKLLNPNDAGVHYRSSVVAYRAGDARGAFEDSDRALQLGKRDSETLTLYAQAAAKLGDLELANKAAAEALALDARNRTAGIVYELTANRASKIKLGGTLAKNGLTAPSSAPGLNALAQSLGQGGPGADAAVSAAGARSQVTAAELAAIASQRANIPASKERQSGALAREASGLIKVQDYEAAATVASQAIELNPQNAQAWSYRAVANGYLNKLNDAVYDASFALKLVPDNTMALQTRSWAFNKQKLYKESLADATTTIEKDPGNAEAYFNASWAYAGLGDKPQALNALKQAADRSARFKPFYENAITAPENADLLLLFQDQPGLNRTLASPQAARRRSLRFIFLVLLGGLLTALAVLHIVSATWRERINATVRRALGTAAEAGTGASTVPLELAGAAPAGSQGIWAQYTPIRTLGQGGMGVVYEAVDRALDRKVAVKKMREEIRSDPGERQRFITEARTVAGLRHPNLVEIYSIVEDSQDVYLVFEYVPGATLAEKLKEGPMELDEARRVLSGACAAVEHAHKNNIIHRDLKPSNIMLGDGDCKVMDFGVARQAKDAMTKMALTNTIVGTPPYMAPEQEQGSVRKESDVFALGVCFYEMLTGHLPFGGVGAGMLLNKINGRYAPLSQKARAKISPALDAAVAKALAGDPDKRFRTPAEFLAAVEAACGSPTPA